MSTDLNKKTLRHFYCRDVLWQCFERMSEDFDRGVDDLVNEAMRLFAREKGYMPGDNESRPTTMRSGASVLPPPARLPPPPPPPRSPTVPQPERPAPGTPAPVPRGYGPGGLHENSAPPLYVEFQNQKYVIDKDQFIIGRGAKTADLPIRDGNISRKHAAVICKNGTYYIKDLGSTNGIDFNGVRIDNKRIEEGDIFQICDYQLKFSYE